MARLSEIILDSAAYDVLVAQAVEAYRLPSGLPQVEELYNEQRAYWLGRPASHLIEFLRKFDPMSGVTKDESSGTLVITLPDVHLQLSLGEQMLVLAGRTADGAAFHRVIVDTAGVRIQHFDRTLVTTSMVRFDPERDGPHDARDRYRNPISWLVQELTSRTVPWDPNPTGRRGWLERVEYFRHEPVGWKLRNYSLRYIT
jgi:hypothetical protein